MSAAREPTDPTIYPDEDDVGEDLLQRLISELLRPLLARWLAERNERVLVGADQFIYYEQFNSTARVSPDVYVIPGVEPDRVIRSWKIWQTGIAPSFALEVVSSNWRKDYEGVPLRYGELGLTELIVFDPHHTDRRQGIRFQRHARDAAGKFALRERSNDDRMHSSVLGGSLVVIGEGSQQRLRIADRAGNIFPTETEAERTAKEAERREKEAERREKEAERREKEAERRAKDAALSAKDAALARVAELEAQLKQR